ncbi:hypothetical protein [Mycobacterium deserti]|uniref:Uncharacterized protein n=1 Tax=Mycobacterium deserti TaxID=2978347 RepID=A0ABT2M9E7_9MYCO|nr:hypothetical protein [Mycobacterium deserti]MCT7657631.1 hypothetical protein [Mycobacterium deserti]
MTSDAMNTAGERPSAILGGGALVVLMLRFTLAQLRHDLGQLGILLDEIRRAGPGSLWAFAAALSAAAANGFTALCGGDRQSAARKFASAGSGGVRLSEEGAARLVLAWLTEPGTVGDVLRDIENQGGLDLVERVAAVLNGMVAQSVVQQCGGNRKAAARNVEAQLADERSRPTE